jgi:DUF917 family protein
MSIVLADRLGAAGLPLLAELPPGAHFCAVGMMGGPSVFAERPPSGREFGIARDLLVRLGMPPPTVLLPIETAGVNGAYAALIAAGEGLPLFDGDLMGRALPRIEQTTSAEGIAFGPAVLVPPTGEAVFVDTASAAAIERIMRAALPECGGWGLFVTRPYSAEELAGRIVPGTISRAISLGQALRRLPPWARSRQIAEALQGRLLGSGTITEIIRRPRQGAFAGGSLYLADKESGAIIRLEYQNEYLLAAVDGRAVVTCPDLLIAADPRVRRLISPADARIGLEVAIIALAGPGWWKENPKRLALVSPRAFGIDQDPIPWEA